MYNLDNKIEKYIDLMKKKHGVTSAMVVGSYAKGTMNPNSDVDLYFIGPKLDFCERGREYFEDIEFEYFINPEWKYYHRMLEDKTTLHILSSGKILFDSNGQMEILKKKASNKIKDYAPQLKEQRKKDYAFHLETIRKDGEDLHRQGNIEDFLYFTGSKINFLAEVICLLRSKLPIYAKYGVSEMKEVDPTFSALLKNFLLASHVDQKKGQKWIELCLYVSKALGNVDIKTYKNVVKLALE